MRAIIGKPVQSGIAVGPIRFHTRRPISSQPHAVLSPEEERARFELAWAQAREQLNQLWEASSCRLGEDLANIFLVQSTILNDCEFLDAVYTSLADEHTAEEAVTTVSEESAALLEAIGDSYLRARADDIRDAARRLLTILSGQTADALAPTPGILLAPELSPSEAINLAPTSLMGLASSDGSTHSHSAIMARAMGIPAITGIQIDPEWEGQLAVLNGTEGILYLDPDEATLTRAHAIQRKFHRHQADLLSLATQPCVTRDGQSVRLCANIASPREAIQAWNMGCQGIGLFRSEFLFLGRDYCPSEEEQFIAYQQTLMAMNGRPVIIRTLDIGADKQVPCLHQPIEINPAMGLRGIRYSLAHPELFRQQLRAILRASAYGPLSVMFPMVTSVSEIRSAKAMLDACRLELDQQNIPYGPLEIGTMIETPAAVVLAEELAQEVDFFSLGTNDLAQYTLAADRQSPYLDTVYDARHPALLRLILHTVETGHRHGCWVGLCGELAADPAMTQWLLKIGLDELSVSPGALLTIREKIGTISLADTLQEELI